MYDILLDEKSLAQCSITIDTEHLADMLLKTDIENQTAFFNRFLSMSSFDNICQLSIGIGKNDRAYLGLKDLFERANKKHIEVDKKRLEYEQSEEAKRDREYNDRLFEYSPDGRPWR